MTDEASPEAQGAADEGAGDRRPTGERIAPVTSLGPQRRRRARRSLLAEWPLALVLVIVSGGIALIAFASFRLGAVLVAVGVLVGFALRLTLPESSVGMLEVRSRPLDLSILGVVGVLLLILAFLVPAPS